MRFDVRIVTPDEFQAWAADRARQSNDETASEPHEMGRGGAAPTGSTA
jgi:heme/copper-type cytochrome/quinol oxidase subunit 2